VGGCGAERCWWGVGGGGGGGGVWVRLGGMLCQEIFKKEHSETLFSEILETKHPFSRQGWSSLKFSLRSKIFNENGQMVGDAGGGMATTEFSVVIIANLFFFNRISKKT